MMSLAQIETGMDQYESAIIDLYECVQSDALLIELIIADRDTPRRRSRRLRLVRTATQRSKQSIELFELALANLATERRRHLAGDIID